AMNYDKFGVMRFTADGAVDESFGPNGAQTANFPPYPMAASVVVQADDKVIAVGTNGNAYGADFCIVRFELTYTSDPPPSMPMPDWTNGSTHHDDSDDNEEPATDDEVDEPTVTPPQDQQRDEPAPTPD